MAKRFLYMIALAFTLQLSWGGVSAYCMHESGQASQHLGHHQHKHTDNIAAGDDGNTPAPKKSPVHPDCAACSHITQLSSTREVEVVHPLSSGHEPSAPLPQQAAPYLGQPERPQWIVAA